MENVRRKFWKKWKWIGLAVYTVGLAAGRFLPGWIVAAAYLYGIIVIANLVFFCFRYLKDRFFWRVRNRVIGSFIFIGVIPLLIVLGLIALAAYLLFGQLAGRYLNDALKENERLVSEINIELAGDISSPDAAHAFAETAASVFSRHADQFPHLAARLVRRGPDGVLKPVAKYDPHAVMKELAPYPGDQWRGEAPLFEGILQNNDWLFLTSFRPIPGRAGAYLELTAPLDAVFSDRLRRERSLYVTFITNKSADINITSDGANVTVKRSGNGTKAEEERIRKELQSRDALAKNDTRRMITWYLAIKGKSYESGKEESPAVVSVRVPWDVVFNTFIVLDDGLGRIFVKIFIALLIIFGFVELLSLIIGAAINRRITRSIHDVHQGILALQKGNLQHKIPVRRNDQLGLLAHSFNQMSGSIARLLEEVVEKKRLEKELEIAREVQATLFPKQLPQPPGMSIFGGCKPAQIVSGDYYDFIVEDETHLDIVVGDISGKGISAALLMANLQAAMRSQLLSSKHNNPDAIGQSLADAMTQLNHQIYLNSPPEKYATLFLSRYDANSRRLWYCNAGHPPAIVLNARRSQTLDATGTVVGLFPDATYKANCIELTPGTLLAIFTDGVTEALNNADEEFGDRQLLSALQHSSMRTPEAIWEHVMTTVGEWQSNLPQYDDITLIVAKTG